jgi:predicted metalloprotease
MRLRGKVNTGQIEDRRGGSRRGMAIGGGGAGIVGVVLAIVFTLAGGGNSADVLRQLQAPSSTTTGSEPLSCPNDAQTSTACFVTAVVNDVQATWSDIFAKSGQHYENTKLVLYTDSTSSGCGPANSAVGPFYCPADQKVYLDLGFFQELRSRFGAPGDFAQAYVIAHEFGHHVQNLLGTSDKVYRAEQRNRGDANALSVRLELQADCFAGVWAANTSAQPNPDDFKEALDAAASVGDDRLQKQAGQRVNQDTWTHGSSAERMRWFQRGLSNGSMTDCDTFSATTL